MEEDEDIAQGNIFQCTCCGYNTKHRQNLVRHRLAAHAKMEQCAHCDYKTKHKNNLLRHVESVHLMTTIYKCEVPSCKFKTKYEESLEKHYDSTKHNINGNDLVYQYIEDTQMYKCKDCDHQTKHKRDLERHSWLHKTPNELTWYKCTQCKFSTLYKDSLYKHNLVHRRPEEIEMFHCYHCDFKSKDKSYLVMHIKSHNPENLHKCPEPGCKYGTVFKKFLKKHLVIHQVPSELYSCELCSFTTKYQKSLEKHTSYHEKKKDIQTVKCKYCHLESNNKTKMARHMTSCEKNMRVKDRKDIISKYDINNDTFKCMLCEYESKNNQQVKNHYLKHKDPNEVETFSCSKCDFKTIHKNTFYTHQKIVHARPEDWIQCAHCEFKTKYKVSLILHLKLHQNSENVKYFYCDQCEYKSFQQSNLRTHKKNHRPREEVANIKCTMCSYRSRSQKTMSIHKSMHKKGKFFSCFLCKFETFDKNAIKEHNQKFHTDENGESIFDCPYCLYSDKNKSSIKSHLITHKSSEEAVIYKCHAPDCNFETKHGPYLKKHYYTLHEDEKNVKILKCSKCDYQTRRNEYLYKHVKNMHTDTSELTWYKCNVCPYQGRQKKQMKSHMRRRHPTSKKILKCPYCKYKTLIEEYIVKHVKKKHGKTYEPSTSTNGQNFNKYYDENTDVTDEYEGKSKCNNSYYERDSYFCFLCKFTTNYRNGMVEHNAQFHTDSDGHPLYKCPHCLISKRRKDAIKIHMLVHASNEAEIFKCLKSDCKFTTKYKSHIKKHYHQMHDENAKLLKCTACPHTTKSKDGLRKHVRICPSDRSKLRLYQCYLCPTYKTKTKALLISHMTNRHAPKVFKCLDCKYKTLSQECIIRHISAKHDIHTYETETDVKKNVISEMKEKSDEQNQDCDKIKIEPDENINFNMSLNALVDENIKLENVEYDIKNFEEFEEINEGCIVHDEYLEEKSLEVENTGKTEMELHQNIDLNIDCNKSICNNIELKNEKYNGHIIQVSTVDSVNINTEMNACSLCSFESESLNIFKDHIFTEHLV